MVQAMGGGGGGGGSYPRYPSKPAVSAPKKPYKKKVGISGVTATRRTGGGSSRRSSGGSSGRRGNYSGGGGSGGAYGRSGNTGVGSNSSGFIAPKPPPPPSLQQFLGTDSTFMQQKSALDKARADYLAQQGQSRTQYETNYLSDRDTLGKNRTQSLADLENDYASRGLLQSGLYADSMSDMTTDYDKRGSALEQAKAAFLAQLAGDLTNFQAEQGLTLTKAQQEAAARRAAQYGA